MSWHKQRLAGLDIETTGIDVNSCRIVAAAISILGGDRPAKHRYWLVDPGIEIPVEATAVHGISTEHARTEGRLPREAVDEITATLADQVRHGVPIVAFNARFDFTILDRETQRHGLPALADRVNEHEVVVMDPFILDRQFDRFRAGKRTLTAVCEHYRVALGMPHVSNTDAIAATLLALRLVGRVPELRDMDPSVLHRRQIAWAAGQAASFEAHLRRGGCEDRVEQAWPIVPSASPTQSGPISYRRPSPTHSQHKPRPRQSSSSPGRTTRRPTSQQTPGR
jgi:DNA polymerase-3 subunit epsilon